MDSELALDLQGGTQIILEAQTADGSRADRRSSWTRRSRSSASASTPPVSARPRSRPQGGNNIVVQIPGQADEETRAAHRGSPRSSQLRAVLYAGAPATTFVGEDGKETPYPTPDPTSAVHADGIADQRQRPGVDHPRAAGRVPRLRLRRRRPTTRRTRPADEPLITCDADGTRQVHPRSGRARRIIDRRRRRFGLSSRPTASGRQHQVRRRRHRRPSARSASASTAPTAPLNQFAFVLDGHVLSAPVDERASSSTATRRSPATSRRRPSKIARRPAQVRRAAAELHGARAPTRSRRRSARSSCRSA